MSVLLQISDPHFGTEQLPVVSALEALSQQQRPDLLVLSGDITQRARPSHFLAARVFVDRLGRPVLAVPGNHDIPLFDLVTRFTRPYVVPLPCLARPMWAVQAGTCVSWRVRDGMPNSVNLVRWGSDAVEGRCLIERWDYAAASASFVRSRVDELEPARGRVDG